MMHMCSFNHETIVFEGDVQCPLCKVMDRLSDLEAHFRLRAASLAASIESVDEEDAPTDDELRKIEGERTSAMERDTPLGEELDDTPLPDDPNELDKEEGVQDEDLDGPSEQDLILDDPERDIMEDTEAIIIEPDSFFDDPHEPVEPGLQIVTENPDL